MFGKQTDGRAPRAPASELSDRATIARRLEQAPALAKQQVVFPGSTVEMAAGVYGFVDRGGLQLLHAQDLHALVARLDDVIGAFGSIGRQRRPGLILRFNDDLPDQTRDNDASRSASDDAASARPAEQDRLAAEQRLLGECGNLVLFDDEGKSGERLTTRGLHGGERGLPAADREAYLRLRRQIVEALNLFRHREWLRLDRAYLVFNRIKRLDGGQLPMDRGGRAEGREAQAKIPVAAPSYAWGSVKLPSDTAEELEEVMFEFSHYDAIHGPGGRLTGTEPAPARVLNLYGPPGTGKTALAHAIAHRLGLRIMVVTYAQIDSALVGEAAKVIRRVFAQASAAGALLFIDEADSLLSQRPTRFSQGADYHVGSMRSELFTEISHFDGILLLATNNVGSYDKAFVSRISAAIEMPLPDAATRALIWEHKLGPSARAAADVEPTWLAGLCDGFSGRDITQAVRLAVARALRRGPDSPIERADFEGAIRRHRAKAALAARREAGPPRPSEVSVEGVAPKHAPTVDDAEVRR